MPRDIAALTAQFEHSNNAGKINLFQIVVIEITNEIHRGVFTSSPTGIRDILTVFDSIDRTSEAIIHLANSIRQCLRDMQYSNNALYSSQIEPINELLTFLSEQEIEIIDDNSIHSNDCNGDIDNKKEPEEISYGISAPIAIPCSTMRGESDNENYTTVGRSILQESIFDRMMSISAAREESYSIGRMSYSFKDLKKGPFDDDYEGGGII